MTLVVLMTGLVSALGCGVLERARIRADVDGARVVSIAGDVGGVVTSTSGASCAPLHGRGGLLVALARALGEPPSVASDDEPDDELEAGDSPDLFDDDGPQGFVVIAFAGLSMPRLAALSVEPNLWGLQSSFGHPQGDDEPPRV
jgi:hypothetical protein